MSEKEIQDFLIEGRVAILATNGPSGYPHQVAMRYGVVDGKVCFETKAKSQKAVNLRRDPKLSISVEAGDSYDQLRGVAIDGTARIIDDTSDPLYWAAGVNVFERYQAASVDALRDYRRNTVIGAEMCTQCVVLQRVSQYASHGALALHDCRYRHSRRQSG